MQEGVVTDNYKISRISPLYKKGASNECDNYRPVSLLPSLFKILEKAICKQLMNYINTHNLICDHQHGFRPKNQTTHVIQNMMNFRTTAATKNEVVIATYIDLSKAFDCLQYDKLFRKLESLYLTPKVVDWYKSYLQGRKQCVEIENNISEMLDVRLGVPQGSTLGPILFLIYVNDINDCDNTAVSFTKLTDDTTVLASAPTLMEACIIMNKALINVNLWFQRNKLNLNPCKTRYIILYLIAIQRI